MPYKPNNSRLSILTISIALFTFILFAFSTCTSQTKWVGTWSTSEQLVEPRNNPPAPGLSNNMLRQVVRVSIGGDMMRVRFSNEFSKSLVTMKRVTIATSTGGSAIDTATIKELKFDSKTEVTMNPGAAVMSDSLSFNLKPRMDVAITISFGETSPDVTGHPGSRTTSYILAGNASEKDFTGAVPTDHWYVINGIDVMAPENAAAVVTLGNSITDGRGSGTNKQNRWPDILSERLLKNPDTKKIGVLNAGIGGNCVLRQCLGSSALDRFERDVLNQSGVLWLIIFEGVNDIGEVRSSEAASKIASDLIAAYEQMIALAHAKKIKVFGGTILPFKGHSYFNEHSEQCRNKVNEWIRASGKFDAVIDFDKALRDPQDNAKLGVSTFQNDGLHLDEAGYQKMGEFIDLNLFK